MGSFPSGKGNSYFFVNCHLAFSPSLFLWILLIRYWICCTDPSEFCFVLFLLPLCSVFHLFVVVDYILGHFFVFIFQPVCLTFNSGCHFQFQELFSVAIFIFIFILFLFDGYNLSLWGYCLQFCELFLCFKYSEYGFVPFFFSLSLSLVGGFLQKCSSS